MGKFLYPLPEKVLNNTDSHYYQGAHTYPGHDVGKLDLPCATGTPVKAMTDGEVTHAGLQLDSRYQYVEIKVTDNSYKMPEQGYFFIRYFHIGNIQVSVGDYVKQGDLIAYTGEDQSVERVSDHLHVDFVLDPSPDFWGPTLQNNQLNDSQIDAYSRWDNQGGSSQRGRCWEIFGTKAKYETVSSYTNGGFVAQDLEGANGTYNNGKYVFTCFKQGSYNLKYPGSWVGLDYSEGNYATSACGATTCAIIISGYQTGMTPEVFGEQNKKTGGLVTDSNTLMNTASGYPFYYKTYAISNEQEAIEYLLQGYGVVYNVNGSGGGHYVAMLDYKDGKYLIADSAGFFQTPKFVTKAELDNGTYTGMTTKKGGFRFVITNMKVN